MIGNNLSEIFSNYFNTSSLNVNDGINIPLSIDIGDVSYKQIRELAKEYEGVSGSLTALSLKQKKYSDEVIKATLAEQGYGDAISENILKQIESADVTDDNVKKTNSLIASKKALSIAQGVLNTALNVGITLLLAMVATKAVEWVSSLSKNHEELANAVRESYNEYEGLTSEIESINTELEETGRRIDELNAKESLTLVEQDELSKLKESNNELERKLKIQEALAEEAKREANEDAKTFFEQEVAYEYNDNSGQFVSETGNIIEITTSQIERYLEFQEKLEKAEEELAKINDVSSAEYKRKQEEIDNYSSSLEDLNDVIYDNIREFQEFDGALLSDDVISKGYIKQLDDLYAKFDQMSYNYGNSAENKIEGILSKPTLEGVKDELVKLGEEGQLSVDVISNKFGTLKTYVEDAGLSVQNLYDHIMAIANAGSINFNVLRDQMYDQLVAPETNILWRNSLNEQFNDWYKSLDNEELEILYSIKANTDTSSWTIEDFDKKIKEIKESKIEPEVNVKTDQISKINELSEGFESLDKIMASIKDADNPFDYALLDDENFKETFSVLGESYENFIETISNSPKDINECQSAFNDLVSVWLNSSGVLDGITEGTASLTEAMLRNMGIVNANEIVTRELVANQKIATLTTKESQQAALDEALALVEEGEQLDYTTQRVIEYVLEKQMANSNILDTTADIQNIKALIEACGGGVTALQALYNAKSGVFNSDMGLSNDEMKALTSYNLTGNLPLNPEDALDLQNAKNKYDTYVNNTYQDALDEINAAFDNLAKVNTANYTGGTKTNKGGGGSGSDKAPTMFDSAAESVNNLKNQLEDLNDVLDKTDPYSQKLPVIQALINKQQEYNNALQNQAAVYKTEYDNALAALPEEWQQRITGYETFSIDVVPENLQDAVENAQTYRDKWNEVNDAIRQGNSDLKDQNSILQELAQTKLDNEIGLIENNVSDIQNQIDLIESLDLHATEDQYRELISSMDSEIGLLNSKLQGYYAQLYELEASGATDSDEYYETADAIQECEDSIYECIQNQYEWNQAMLEIPLDYLEEVNDELNEELESLQEIQSNYDSAISGVVSYIEEQIEKQEELREAEEEAYQAQIDAVQDEIDLANDQIDATNDLIDSLNEQIEAIEKQKELKQEQIDAVQDEIDALQKANEERKEQLNLEEKQYNLERARNQKTNRIYREGQGFVYEADQDAIRDAQDELDDALFDKQISDLEDIIDGYEDEMGAYDDQIEGIEDQIEGYDDIIEGLNEKIDELNEKIEGIEETRDEILQTYDDEIERLQGIADSWNDIASSLQRYKDMLMADQVLGSGWQDRVTSGDTSDLDNMTGKYEENDRQQTWVEKQIEDNEKLIDSVERYIDAWQQGEIEIDEALESINDIVGDIYPEINSNNERVESILAYQDQWTSARFSVEEDIAATNEATANNDPELTATEQRRAAAQAYANQWATSVLSVQGSLSQITTAQQNATNSEDTMLQQRITNLGNFRDSYKSIGAEIASSCDSIIESCNDAIRALKRLEKAENGSSSDDDNLKYLPFGYAKGTKSAKPGLHPVAEKDKPEIIINNDGTSLLAKKETYYPFKGGETVIDANDTQDILEMKGLKPLSQSDLMFSEDKMNLFYNMKQDMVPKFASSGTYLKDVFNSKMPVFTTNNRTDKQGDVNVQISNITLPNVKDADSFVQELSSGRIKAAVNQRLHKK